MSSTRILCVRGSVSVLFLNLFLHVLSFVRHGYSPDLYDFEYFIREDWRALPPKHKQLLQLPAPYVVIHHTPALKPCYELKECISTVRLLQIQHMHLNWGDIGYNFCIGSEGFVFQGRGWEHVGEHAGLGNNQSIGICMIGHWEKTAPPEAQMNALKALIRTGVLTGKLRSDYKLIGHMQTKSTDCPGDALMAKLSTFEHFVPGMHDFRQPSIMNGPYVQNFWKG